jgi:hypothetical protein
MRKKALVYCEHCGGTELSGTTEFIVFECLAFCSPDCRDDFRAADEERREAKRAFAELATVAEVMRRRPNQTVTRKRARAA